MGWFSPTAPTESALVNELAIWLERATLGGLSTTRDALGVVHELVARLDASAASLLAPLERALEVAARFLTEHPELSRALFVAFVLVGLVLLGRLTPLQALARHPDWATF